MAGKFKLLSFAWLACLVLAGSSTNTAPSPTTTTTASVDSSTTPVPSTTTTTTASVGSSTTLVPSTTTTALVGSSTTPAPSSTTTAVSVGSSTTPAPSSTTTTVSVGSSTTPAPSTTTTVSVGSSTTPVPSSTTTASVGSSTTPAPSTTTTALVGSSTTPVPSSTTTALVGSSTTPAPSTTTTASVGSSTTPAPSSTTTASVGSSTTSVPSSTTTASVGSSTTPAPSTTTTASVGSSTTPVPSSTTTALVGSSTTLVPSSIAPGSVGSSTTLVPSSTTAPGPCNPNPCGQGSTCDVRAKETFVCLCLAGDNYNYVSKSCENAKVFPGQLDLPRLEYENNMSDKTSPEFEEALQNITAMLLTVFDPSDGYSNTTVLELKPTGQSKVGSRSSNGVTASVEIIFNTNSNITTDEVKNKMVNASKCDSCLLRDATFQNTELCDKNPCDKTTTECTSENGSYKCTCTKNYINTDFSDRICIACPSGTQAQDSLRCVDCPYGYSGLNCSEPWHLVLVIVGSVSGILLIIAVILLIVLALKPSKKISKKKKNADTGKPYVSHPPAKSPLVNGNSSSVNSQAPSFNGLALGGAGVPRIPRATATSSWDSRTNLEMTPSNSRQNLIPVGRNPQLDDDQDDMSPYTQSRPQSSLYSQTRPQNNPYAQNRPQINPYAQNQGKTNPYYTHDNERWMN
ncbi:mucin-13b [Toxotes jaculatrix]|uniref:mucin-13b n=1 Tax=Toxotes jaculatrix TaxID=941984 RepID=UPI001B3AD9E4|nr:mucin-13b [Toxotes jaculatrix]